MEQPEQILRHKTRRSFLVGGLAALAGTGTFFWIRSRDGDIPWPLRRVHRLNEGLGRAIQSPTRLAKEYPKSLAEDPRVNGWIGIQESPVIPNWKIEIQHQDQAGVVTQSLNDLKSLPRYEMTTELKCVEGWSTIVTWAGYRFVDWLNQFGFGQQNGTAYPYVYLATPSEEYYVSLDIATMMHPQTLLCDTMNDQPLTPGHGSPLRLITTLKYGIKNIKQIGKITFHHTQPADYWAERGYDWFAGH